jgi:acyl-CoA thioesterase-1
MVGTSLTAGMGLDPDDAYPTLLQRKVDSAGMAVRIAGAGLSGETSAGALRRIGWLLTQKPRWVFIETGANDGLRGLDVDSTLANLRAIVRAVKAEVPEATILLAQMESPPNLGEQYTTRFRAMFPTVAREEGAILVPFLLDGVAGVPAMNQSDGIHPNEEGARRVAENVWRSLEPVLRAGSTSANQEPLDPGAG